VFVWVLRVEGLAGAVFALMLAIRFITGRLVAPRIVYILGALMGFCGWAAYLASSGVVFFEQRGATGVIWQEWLALAPFALPLEGGLLGWVGVRSRWRWCFLAGGILLALVPVFLLPVLISPSKPS